MSFISQVITLLIEKEYLDIDRSDGASEYFEWNEYFNFAWRNRNCEMSSFDLVDKLMQFTIANSERYSRRLIILRNWNV